MQHKINHYVIHNFIKYRPYWHFMKYKRFNSLINNYSNKLLYTITFYLVDKFSNILDTRILSMASLPSGHDNFSFSLREGKDGFVVIYINKLQQYNFCYFNFFIQPEFSFNIINNTFVAQNYKLNINLFPFKDLYNSFKLLYELQ